MVSGLELTILALVVVVLVGAHGVSRAVRPLIVNAVVGLIVLLLASALGFGVAVTPVVVLIVALGGVPGAVLVLLLAYLDILFQPVVLLPL